MDRSSFRLFPGLLSGDKVLDEKTVVALQHQNLEHSPPTNYFLRSHLANDSESVEMLLQKHALREVFFGQADTENINQLNRSLNIQWAIDLQAQFHRHKRKERLYTNLDEWLHEIEDEDDKEDILGWAEKVSSGKMTEEKFAERVRGK